MFGGKQRGVAGILLLAFVLRVAWIWVEDLDARPGRIFDAAFYHISALQIAAGNGLVRLDGTPTAEWPPGYPLLLGGLYASVGESIPAGKLLNAVLGALTCWFTYLLAARLFGHRIGLLAGGLLAANPGAIFFTHLIMSEVAFTAAFAGAVALFARWNTLAPPAGPGRWLLCGVAIGVATLTRGIAAAFPIVFVAIWLRGSRALHPVLPRALALALGMACVIAPWTIRNAVQLGEPVLIATSLGRTLAHAHTPYETGGASLKAYVYRRQFRRQFAHLPQPERELAVDRAFARAALAYLWNHPLEELSLVPRRLFHLFRHGHVALGIGREQVGPGKGAPYFTAAWHGRLTALADATLYALLALALLGMPRTFDRDNPTALLVPLTVTYFTVFHIVLFPADPRFHLPMLPFLSIAAALGVRGALGRAMSWQLQHRRLRPRP